MMSSNNANNADKRASTPIATSDGQVIPTSSIFGNLIGYIWSRIKGTEYPEPEPVPVSVSASVTDTNSFMKDLSDYSEVNDYRLSRRYSEW